jgi:ketosteroid isomerase-like protein
MRIHLLSLVLLFTACCSVSSSTPTASAKYDLTRASDEVRGAEIAFAKAFADRDKPLFLSMVAEDANFIGPNRTLAGRSAVAEGWAQLLDSPEPAFSWGPERVAVNGDGTLGLSTGPIKDKEGKVVGHYSSIWQRQADGSWKVIFDGPGCPQP